MVPGRRYNVSYLLRRMRERWWALLLPLLVAGSIATIMARALPDIYYAQATVVAVRQRVPESYVRSTVTVSLEERLQTTTQQIMSRTRLEQIITEFNLYRLARQRLPAELVAEWLRRSLNIRLVKPDTFVVGYSGYEPEKVAKVAEYLAELIVRESVRERELLADATSQFLQAELQQTRDRLTEVERRVEGFRRKYAGQLPSQLDANLRILQSTYVQLQGVVESLNRDRDRREELARELAAAGPAAPPAEQAVAEEEEQPAKPETDPIALPAGPPNVRLRVARAMLEKLLLRLTPEHPDVRRLQHIVDELEHTGADGSQNAAGRGPRASTRVAQLQDAIAKLDAQISARQALEKRLRDAIAAYQARVEAVPQREAEWTDLTRDYNTLQGVYTGLLAKREESRIAASLERRQAGEQLRIAERPRVPRRPVSPNRPFIALTGIAVGLGLGAAFLVVRELRHRGLHTEEEVVAALTLPVVGIVPFIQTRAERRRALRWRLAWSAAAIVTVAGLATLKWLR